MSSFTPAELAYLASQRLGRVATAQPSGPLIRIHPERIISFGIDQEFTSPRDLVVNSRNVN